MCSTSFGRAVVPDVKYSSSVSLARVDAVGRELAGASYAVRVVEPAVDGAADRDPRVVARDAVELAGVGRAHDHVARVAALDAVAQVGLGRAASSPG